MLYSARKAGFKVCTMLFRGADGIPITSGKLSHSGAWRDAEYAFEYINKTYVLDSKTGKKATRLYAYGVSLGANILGLYL